MTLEEQISQVVSLLSPLSVLDDNALANVVARVQSPELTRSDVQEIRIQVRQMRLMDAQDERKRKAADTALLGLQIKLPEDEPLAPSVEDAPPETPWMEGAEAEDFRFSIDDFRLKNDVAINQLDDYRARKIFHTIMNVVEDDEVASELSVRFWREIAERIAEVL